MNMYYITESIMEIDNKEVTLYGIGCRFGEKNLEISGISSKREKIEQWVLLMNELKLSPIHFREVIDDIVLV